ncbi:MAG: hypothetical protein QM677_01325 [Microbacterium sp.]
MASFALAVSLLVAAPATAVDASSSTSVVDAEAVGSSLVEAAAVTGFDAENIISDALFYDDDAMTAAEIQSFLDAKIGTCTNSKCLNVLSITANSEDAYYSQTTGDLVCDSLTGGTMMVAEFIYRVQVACGISAKVILVTMQKEQGLVTDTAPTDTELRAAMGHLCSDTAPCETSAYGIANQIFGGTEQLKKYKATAFGKQPGSNYIAYSPTSSCGGTTLDIENYATAALYNYTPYQPNAASLAAGFGLGDSCSSYGNRNFYLYYTKWFGSTQTSTTVNSPIGSLDAVEASPGVFQVTGWAIDPDTTSSIKVHIYVGSVGKAVTANVTRADVGAVYPSYGSAHGFDATVSATGSGATKICAYGINTSSGSNSLLGCKTVTAMSGSPVGNVDSLTYVDGGVSITGWLIDPDTTASGQVHVYVDGVGSIVRANKSRPDVAAQYPAYGALHGFSATISVSSGTHTVCIYGIDVGAGSNVTLKCVKALFPGSGGTQVAPFGSLDSVTVDGQTVTLKGWAIDPDTTSSIQVHTYVGSQGSVTRANQTRTDVARVYPAYGSAHGFTQTVTVPQGTSTVCAYAIDSAGGSNTTLGCQTVTVAMTATEQKRAPIGSLDAVTVSAGTLQVSGWAIDPDTTSSIKVHVYVDGVGTVTTANRARADVAAAYPGYGSAHGFSLSTAISSGTHTVCAYGINTGSGGNTTLGCKTVTVP